MHSAGPYRGNRCLWHFGRLLCRTLYLTAMSGRAFGLRHVPREGGALLAANHQSFLDPMLIGSACSRPVAFMARKTLFEYPVFGNLIRRLNAFPVSRSSADMAAIRTGVDKMRTGELLVVFPEGTRSLDGDIGRISPGAAMMARRADVPIVPVLVRGAYEAWPRQRWLPRPSPVAVAFGRAIPSDALRPRDLPSRLATAYVNMVRRLPGRWPRCTAQAEA